MVTSELLSAFEKQDIEYALMGGFALGLWGAGRATLDMDFLINYNDLTKVDKTMKGLGYECCFQTENVSQYVSPLKIFGEVDFMHAFRAASLEMLQKATVKDIFAGTLKIRVLRPEDIIGLKLQAFTNNPDRKAKELLDIKSLMTVRKGCLDWVLLKKYFKLFKMRDLCEKLFKEYNK